MRGFRYEQGLVQQFVALQNQFFVPGPPVETESYGRTAPAHAPLRVVLRRFRPIAKPRHDDILQRAGRAAPMVFPREIGVPVVPTGFPASIAILAGQREIADRY